jgi:hypothetical protein
MAKPDEGMYIDVSKPEVQASIIQAAATLTAKRFREGIVAEDLVTETVDIARALAKAFVESNPQMPSA